MQSRVLKLIHTKSFIRHVQLVIFLSVQFQDSPLKGIKKAPAYKILSTAKVSAIDQIIDFNQIAQFEFPIRF